MYAREKTFEHLFRSPSTFVTIYYKQYKYKCNVTQIDASVVLVTEN